MESLRSYSRPPKCTSHLGIGLVKNANRMMTTASLLDDGIELTFADGCKGLIPYADVPEVMKREGIFGLE